MLSVGATRHGCRQRTNKNLTPSRQTLLIQGQEEFFPSFKVKVQRALDQARFVSKLGHRKCFIADLAKVRLSNF